MNTKNERIEQINLQIIALMLRRRKAERYKDWTEEESLEKQILELEKKIKLIEAEP